MHIIIIIIILLAICLLLVSLALFVYFIVNIGSSDNSVNKLNPTNGYYLSYVNNLNVPDQGKLNSCGAVQISTLMSYYYNLQTNKSETFSALYLYYYGRSMNGGTNIDKGGAIDNYLRSINNYGLVSEQDWPYIESNVYIKPPNITINYTLKINWDTVDTYISTVKSLITSGQPVLLDINLYSSFSSINYSGIVTLPNITNESYISRHTISLWGWDDDTEHFIMLNTWGTNVGYNGWYFLPYDYILTPGLSTLFVYNITIMNSW